MAQYAAKIADPKYIWKLIRSQKRFNRRMTFLGILTAVYIFKAEERVMEQERKIDRIERELEELKRQKGV